MQVVPPKCQLSLNGYEAEGKYRSEWAAHWRPLQVRVGSTLTPLPVRVGSMLGPLVALAPTHPPLLLHLLNVLNANGTAAAGAKRTRLLPCGALSRDNQGLWGRESVSVPICLGTPVAPPPTGGPATAPRSQQVMSKKGEKNVLSGGLPD